jgi:hypothetical protein
MAYPNDRLLDFWKTLWHVDVHKDHQAGYDKDVVNSYLPDATYRTTQTIGDNYISTAGQEANRNGGDGNVLGFAELFQYLTKVNFSDIQKLKPNAPEFNAELNADVMGKAVNYKIKVFDDKGNAEGSKLDEFIGDNNIALFVDTSSHLPELLQNYNAAKTIAYAYTREIEKRSS